ncbi:hypothetical protein [Gordonia jacobaea]|uniref:hypothetical protein n=1 Tax=Gordonia jacobaea TaxID=122202 RepID=UPI003D708A15
MQGDPTLTRDQVTDLYYTYRNRLSRTGITLSAPAAGTPQHAQWGSGHTDNNAQCPRTFARITEIVGWAWSMIASRIYSWRADAT